MNAVLNARKHLSARAMTNRMQSTTLIGYAKFNSRSHDAVIRVYDELGNVIETNEHAGQFQRVVNSFSVMPVPVTAPSAANADGL
jgi:hypothetical protein